MLIQQAQITFIIQNQTVVMSQANSQSKHSGNPIEQKRQYGCPCGKTYLSYPALFTHVKQKHDGKAPGHLIKPKTEKARGRPKIHLDVPEDQMSDGAFSLSEEIQAVLYDVRIVYNQTFSTSQGNRSCQDMATQFLSKLSTEVDSEGIKVVHCFLNYLRQIAVERNGNNYWIDHKPNDLIDLVNQMCRSHDKYAEKYPLNKTILIDMLYVMFRWMYKTKWTDHKLIKREPVKKIL